MEPFSEDHSKLLLAKEWLVKIGTDNQKSAPYLMKFYSSSVDLQCLILITDTKSMWAEVLSSNQFARRWRQCNLLDAHAFGDSDKEDQWRTNNMELLAKAHTLGAIADISFELAETNYSDLAFELDCQTFKWRWEACFLGYKLSSDLISRHLILPLISFSHLALSSSEPVGEMSDIDVEKAIDKAGRTARRTIDTHIRNAISKPRAATSLARISAMFNFIPELPPVRSTVERPDLQLPPSSGPERLPSSVPARPVSPPPLVTVPESPSSSKNAAALSSKPTAIAALDSATESEPEDNIPLQATAAARSIPDKAAKSSSLASGPVLDEDNSRSRDPQSSGSDSSPVRPAKKMKRSISPSDDENEQEGRSKISQSVPKRGGGTRQPIKRGGKRF